jgi:hypothetical protein
MASTPMFDHEKLDVYQLEVKFPHLGYSISGRYRWSFGNAEARADYPTRSRKSLSAVEHGRGKWTATGAPTGKIF